MSDNLHLRPGYHNLLRREILDLVSPSASAVLDLGCGTGELGKAIKNRQPCFYAGIELNKEASTLAKIHLDKVWSDNLNRFDPATIGRKFDCIILADILEHLIYPWQVLDKFASLLTEQGRVVASVPNIGHPAIIAQLQKGLFRYEHAGIMDITHLRFFTLPTIFQMFCRAGLKIIQVHPFPSEQNPIQYHIIAQKPVLKFKEFLATILILSYNTWPYTIRAIDSIKRLTSTPHKILVIDNGSTDGTVAYLRADKQVFHIENTCNLGFAAGFNTGLQCVDTPYFVLSNSDIVVTKDWLGKMIHNISKDEKLVCLGPRSNSVSGPQKIEGVDYQDLAGMHAFAEKLSARCKDPITYFHRIVFFFALFKTGVLNAIGFLDEIFGIGNYEDDDYCLRIASQGGKCAYDNSTFIHHYGSTTFKKNKINYKQIMDQNRLRFFKKWNLKEPGK